MTYRSSRAVHLVALVVAVEDSVAELVGAHAGGAVAARRVVRAAAGGRGGRAAARLLVRPVRAVHGPVAHPAQRDTTTCHTFSYVTGLKTKTAYFLIGRTENTIFLSN